jgi:hypothetical protein
MAVDSRHPAQMGVIPYPADPLSYRTQVAPPQFNDPWVSGPAGSPSAYVSSQAASNSLDTTAQIQRPGNNLTLPPYNTLPITTTALAPGSSLLTAAYGHPAPLHPPQGLVGNRPYQHFSAATTSTYPAPASQFSLDLHDARNGYGYASDVRRPSHP